MAHDQATMVELKSMLSEMKELLHQQVTCVPVSCVLWGELLKDCSKWSDKEEQNFKIAIINSSIILMIVWLALFEDRLILRLNEIDEIQWLKWKKKVFLENTV